MGSLSSVPQQETLTEVITIEIFGRYRVLDVSEALIRLCQPQLRRRKRHFEALAEIYTSKHLLHISEFPHICLKIFVRREDALHHDRKSRRAAAG